MEQLNESFDSSYPFDKVEKYGKMDIIYTFDDEKGHGFKLHFEKRMSFGKFVYVAVLSQKTPSLKTYKRVFSKFQNAQATISTILAILRDIYDSRKDVKGVVLELPPSAFGPYAGLIRKIVNRELRSLFTIPNIEFTSEEFEGMGLHGFVMVARPNNFKNVFTGKTFLELLNGKDLDAIQPEEEPVADVEPEVVTIPMPSQKLDMKTPLSQQLAPKRQAVQVEIQEEISPRKKVAEGLVAKPNEFDFAKFFILSIFFQLGDNGDYSLSDEDKAAAYADEDLFANALAQSVKGAWIQRIPLIDIISCLAENKIRCKATMRDVKVDEMVKEDLNEMVYILLDRFPSASSTLNLPSTVTALPVNKIIKHHGEDKIAEIIQRVLSNDDTYQASIKERFKYTADGKIEGTVRIERDLIKDFVHAIRLKESSDKIQDYVPDSLRKPWAVADYSTFKKSFVLSWLHENVRDAKVASGYGTRFIDVNSNLDEFYAVAPQETSKAIFDTPKIETQFKRIYNEMQQMLFEQYGDEYQNGEGTIELYRGIRTITDNYTPASAESWTDEIFIAEKFSEGGTILTAEVPFKYILMNKGFMLAQNIEMGEYEGEEEWVVLGGAFKSIPIVKMRPDGYYGESEDTVMNIVLANDPHFKEIYPNDVALGISEEEILNKELERIENQLNKDQTDRLQSEGLLESRSFSFGGRHIVAVMKDQYTISYKMENMVNSYFRRCLNNLLESDVHMVNENEIILKLKV